MISPAWVIAYTAIPIKPIACTGGVGPFNNHDTPDDWARAVDIHDTSDHRATHNMAMNNNVPVVSTPAVPMAGLHRSSLGEDAKEDHA